MPMTKQTKIITEASQDTCVKPDVNVDNAFSERHDIPIATEDQTIHTSRVEARGSSALVNDVDDKCVSNKSGNMFHELYRDRC